jgi:hypothetical protein
MQHEVLDKTKVLKTQRDYKSDLRKPNSKSVLKKFKRSDRYYRPVRPVYLAQLQVWSTGLVQPFYWISELFAWKDAS